MNIRLARKLTKSKETEKTHCLHVFAFINDKIKMTARSEKKDVHSSKMKEERGRGWVSHTTTLLSCRCKLSHVRYSGHAFILQIVKTFGKLFHSTSWRLDVLRLISLQAPKLVPPGYRSSAPPAKSGCLLTESPVMQGSGNQIKVASYKSVFGVWHAEYAGF